MALVREQVVQTAEKYVSRGKIEPAIREYRKLLAENPNDINTLNRIGDLYARINRIDEAVDFFFQIADRYTAEGFFVKAIAIYKKIIKLDPTRLDVYEKLAELYHRQGLVNEARTQYQVLADYYVKHANAASAIAIYQKMSEVEPQNPTYHVRLAEIYREQQLLEKARNEYQIIAEMMLEHDRPQEAAQVYERALDIDASDLGFIEDAVNRLRVAGNEAGAARFLSAAVERNPEAIAIARAAPRIPSKADLDSTSALRAATLDSTAVRKAALDSTASRPAELDSTASRPAPPRRKPPEPPAADLGDETVFAGGDELGIGAPFSPAAPPPPAPLAPMDREPSVAEALAAAAAAAESVDEEVGSGLEAGEFELDLDEVFSLELEDDDEPASLVKPPPDLADQPRRPAWAQPDAEPPVPEPTPAPPAASAAPAAMPAPPAPAFEAEVAVEPVEPAAAEGFGAFFDLAPPDLPDLAGPDLPDQQQIEGARAFARELNLEFDPRREIGLEIDAELLERTASELEPRSLERDEDLVSEAEVLAKYGLEEKALERLREAIRLRRGNLPAYGLIAQIQMEKGRRPKVVEIANEMAEVAAEVGDREHWPRLRKALVGAGYWVEGDRVSLAPVAEPARPEFAPPVPAPEPPMEIPAAELELFEIEEVHDLGEIEELEVELDTEDFAAPETPVIPEAAPPVPPPPSPPIETLAPPDPIEPKPLPAAPAPPPPKAAPPPVVAAPAAARRKGASVDQMLEGLLGDKAAKKKGKPAAPPPAGLVAPPPLSAPPAQAAAPAPLPVAPAKPALFNPLEIGEMIEAEEIEWDEPAGGLAAVDPLTLDDTGMSWLDEADRSRKGDRKGVADETFDDEDDFFDLAAELEQELSREELFQGGDGGLMPSEQSLEEIVEGFKKGVAEHLSATDYDTHFNLGIAYREMGLLDEAIGEFQLAAKDPGHLVLCCSMLGLCFQDKGMPELAAKWYHKGLDAPGVSEEDHLGLLYDLGNALDASGDRDGAYKVFVDLYGIDSNYRDVVARVEELSPGR